MIRLWPWRRAAQPVQCSPHDCVDDGASLPYGPWSSVSVFNDAVEQGEPGWLVASRSFTDPAEAARVHAAWQRHAPELRAELHHGTRSSFAPSHTGFYLDAAGTQHAGQPAEIDALISEEIAAAEERAAQRATEAAQLQQRLALREAEREARRPKEIVVAEAGDDSPFAHHDKFVKATQVFAGGHPVEPVRFHFTEFTGHEPKPTCPVPHYVQGATDDERDRHRLIRAEFDAAVTLWTRAAYRRRASAELRAAARAWPKVAEAFARIEQAWSDLDHPPHGWEVAVKQLLDAHDAAKPVVSDWEDLHATRLATLGADLAVDDEDLAELRVWMGTELGIDDVADWRVGRGVDHRGDGRFIEITDGASDHLRDLVAFQRARLAEITDAAGRVRR